MLALKLSSDFKIEIRIIHLETILKFWLFLGLKKVFFNILKIIKKFTNKICFHVKPTKKHLTQKPSKDISIHV